MLYSFYGFYSIAGVKQEKSEPRRCADPPKTPGNSTSAWCIASNEFKGEAEALET